jgi:hypothetical protein
MKRSRSVQVLDDDPGLLRVVAHLKEHGMWSKLAELQSEFSDLPSLPSIVKSLVGRGLAVKGEGGDAIVLLPELVVKRVEQMTEERNERHLKVVLFDVAACVDQGVSKKTLKKKGLAVNLVEDALKKLLDEELVVQIKPPLERDMLMLASWIAPSSELVGQLWYSDEERSYNRRLIDLVMAVICKAGRSSASSPVVSQSDLEKEFVKNGSVIYKSEFPGSKVVLKEADMQPLLALLIADGSILQVHGGFATTQRGLARIEKARSMMLDKKKSKLKEEEEAKTLSGAYSMPCPTCQQRSVCRVDGLVSPKSCVPLKEWLNW